MNKQYHYEEAQKNYERYIMNGVTQFLAEAINSYNTYKSMNGKKKIDAIEEYLVWYTNMLYISKKFTT